jgi:putative ABC transport system permease protein
MNATSLQLLYTAQDALLFSLATLGVFVSFRILRFPDLTAEGGYGLAATVGGMVVVATGSFGLGLAASTAAGAATGVATSLLTNLTRLPTILSSILVMTMSVSLALLICGRPNVSLPSGWILGSFQKALGMPVLGGIAAAAAIVAIVGAGLMVLMHSGAGLLLRTRGENPRLLAELGRSLVLWDIIGVGLGNGLIGLAAGLSSQQAGYTSIQMGRGVVIGALAAILLGESLVPHMTLARSMACCVLGTLILRMIRLLGLSLGMPDGSLDLVTSVIVVVFYVAARRSPATRVELLDNIRM